MYLYGVSYSSKKHAETILLAYPDDELNLVDDHIHIARDVGGNTDHLTPLDQLWLYSVTSARATHSTCPHHLP